MKSTPYGFRIVGPTWESRRLVDAAAALAGYAVCNPKAEVQREAYLSAFQFGEEFRQLLTETGSTAGYQGPCWSPWLWFDIDRDGLADALKDARRLAANLDERYRLPDDALLVFFSGSKGFHIGLPTCLWSPEPSETFHKTARQFAEHVAELASVTIDVGVYDKVRAFRAPNSRHSKTALHKRRLSVDELMGLSLEAILDRAKEPEPFDLPEPTGTSEPAAADWQQAIGQVEREAEAKAQRRDAGITGTSLNRRTLEFIRAGAAVGDRHRLLYSAAANLAEFGCSLRLAVALLQESALDTGLPPRDVRRQIECGLASVGADPMPQDASKSPQTGPDDATGQDPTKCEVGDSKGSQRQSCQQVTRASTPTEAELAALWSRSAPTADKAPPRQPARNPDDERLTPPRMKPAPPEPPAGARLHIVNDKMRPCSPAECYTWSWEGAPRWYYAADYPLPGADGGSKA